MRPSSHPLSKVLVGGALTAAVMALTPDALADKPTGTAAAASDPAGDAAPGPPEDAPAPPASVAIGPPVPAPVTAPAPTAGTPLSLRPAPSPLGTGGGAGSLGPQLALAALIGAAGLWAWKRRARRKDAAYAAPKILARTAVGVRSELLVVEVDGQTMLIGVTPQSIQRIAVLSAVNAGSATGPVLIHEAEGEPGFRSLWNDDTLQDVEPPRHAFPQAQSLADAAARMNAIARSAKSTSVLNAIQQGRQRPAKGPTAPPESGTQRTGVPSGSDIEEQARGLLDARGRR